MIDIVVTQLSQWVTAAVWYLQTHQEHQDHLQVMKPMRLIATVLANYRSITKDKEATIMTMLHAKNWENIKEAIIFETLTLEKNKRMNWERMISKDSTSDVDDLPSVDVKSDNKVPESPQMAQVIRVMGSTR